MTRRAALWSLFGLGNAATNQEKRREYSLACNGEDEQDL